ncbi:hypothetical protein [Mesorhizobium sp.]|uniref:hypothetical protein n=1 Tax=Mesorhizobium sp. TaxID=1871066 RepID=UPI0025EFF281|nr:hypothetical protein [Mesorhizobium sp.]
MRYTGAKHNIPRYSCWRGLLDNGEPRCIAFGGLRVDDAIEEALLHVVKPGEIAAAAQAEGQAAGRRDQVRDALSRDPELPVTPPAGLSGNMMPPIPKTGWLRRNWRCDGTAPSRMSATSKAGSLPMMQRHRNRHLW